MSQVTGIVTIKLDGREVQSKEGAKLNTGGFQRTSVVVGKKVHYSEKVMPASIECTLAHMATTSVTWLNGITNATAIFETDTGKKYTINGAFVSEPCSLTGGEGDLTLKLEGPPAKED